MAAPTPLDVAGFLGLMGQGDDAAVLEQAEQFLGVMTSLVKGWTRGRGFTPDPADDLAAVIVTATARLLSNPAQYRREEIDGYSVAGGFDGFTLPETLILNRYRRRAA